MVKKLQKILEKIKLNNGKSLYDFNLTIDEYLLKDENGISFLEHIFLLGIDIPYRDEEKLKNSIEAGYIYIKNGKGIYSFEYTEEQLFSIIGDKTFIEFLIENDRISSRHIGVIKEHLEIIDMLPISSSYMLSYLTEELKEKLMTKNSNNNYLIERYFKSEKQIQELIPLFNDPKILIELCKKYNVYDYLVHSNEFALMYEISENYTLLDDLLDKDLEPKKLNSLPTNKEYINYLRKKNLYNYLKDAREEIFLLEIEEGKTLLEELIEKGFITNLEKIIYKEDTIRILDRMNKLNLISGVDKDLLILPVEKILGKQSNMLLIEYFFDKGVNFSYQSFYCDSAEKKIIQILYDRKKFEMLTNNATNEKLLFEVEDGITLIDKLLDENLNIEFHWGGFNEIVADKLLKKERYDLLAKGSLKILLTNINEKDTYLDLVLDAIKSKKIKCKLKSIDSLNTSSTELAKFYLAIAKHDMIEYIPQLTEYNLLKDWDGKTLLDELLNIDRDLTISKVLKDDIKSKMKIAIILKSYGLEQKNIDVPIDNKNFKNNYLNDNQNRLGIGPLKYEGEFLLNKLNDLFLNDGESNKELVSALISGYRHSLFVDYERNIQELRNLVEIKENNTDKFLYLKEESDGAFFRPGTGTVHCDDLIVQTILHETGHALHEYLQNSKKADDYDNIVKSVRQNPETLKKVEEFANKYSLVKEKVKQLSEKKYEKFLEMYFTENRKKELDEFLNKTLEEKKEEFKTLGLSDDVLNLILDNVFDSEEYIEQQKRIFIDEYAEAVFRTEFGSLMAIGDILDAIYEGELNSGILKNEKGENITKTCGHGIAYYYDSPELGFSEMIANFAAISKQNDSIDKLDLLKDIVGDELYNMLSEFYYNNIAKNNTEELKRL